MQRYKFYSTWIFQVIPNHKSNDYRRGFELSLPFLQLEVHSAERQEISVLDWNDMNVSPLFMKIKVKWKGRVLWFWTLTLGYNSQYILIRQEGRYLGTKQCILISGNFRMRNHIPLLVWTFLSCSYNRSWLISRHLHHSRQVWLESDNTICCWKWEF